MQATHAHAPNAAPPHVPRATNQLPHRLLRRLLLCLHHRDRLYEAGFDEAVTLTWLQQLSPDAPLEVATPEFARYAAVALIAGLGAAGFAAGALRELEGLKSLRVMDR